MSNYRLFPRYDISKLPFITSLLFEDNSILDHSELLLLDISVSGVRIKSNFAIELPTQKLIIKINSENFNFEIPINTIWSADYPDKSTHYGFKFKFNDISTFNGWLGFVKALHFLSLKSPYKLPNPINRFK